MLIFTEECYMQHLGIACGFGFILAKTLFSGSATPKQKEDPQMLKKLTGGNNGAIVPFQPSKVMQPVGGQFVSSQPQQKPSFIQSLFGERLTNDNRAQVFEEQEHFDPSTGNITTRNTRMSFDKR